MKGGELEVINEPPEKAMQMLENDEIKEGVNTEIVSYKVESVTSFYKNLSKKSGNKLLNMVTLLL